MDLFEAINERRSIRKFQPRPLSDECIKRIFSAIRKAPSASNAQPYKFIVVNDEDLKLKVASACHDGRWIAEAPVVVVACGIVDDAYPTLGGFMSSYPVDVGVALGYFTLAAVNEGLGCTIIPSFKEEKVKEVLNIPQDVRVLAIIPIGYPAEKPDPSPKKHVSDLVEYNKYR